ncbi:DNA alkylation repair protein [Chungangia koreensis]|uniref:DNA alkylation repair protein n=1 Tax=Chungangia koreensis TaxID=752657 RepID=A0ABV8X5P6_9LACT
MKLNWDRQALITYFSDHKNIEKSPKMASYMKNRFPFLGIDSPLRTDLLKRYFSQYELPPASQAWDEVFALYELPEREYHYAAIALIGKIQPSIEDIGLIRQIIETKSWWDSVDSIAPSILGNIVRRNREKGEEVMRNWSLSDNFWVVRAALLHQLKYKAETNECLLFSMIERHADSEEFFVQKAIGWVLREYAKTNPENVRKFVKSIELKPLSRREALKHIQ